MTALVRPQTPEHDVDTLRQRVAALDVQLAARAAEVARAKADLETFRIRYRQDVGRLHEELDELELRLAEIELGELAKLIAERGGASDETPAPSAADAAPRFTSDAVRKLFREVARSIHPDLADDETARQRRHALMVAANRAYALGDEDQLRRILQAWDRSPEAVPGTDAAAVTARLLRRQSQIEEELAALDREIAALGETSLFKLKAMVDAAAAEGKDLVAEMVRRLQREILVTRNRLDAMTWSPAGD